MSKAKSWQWGTDQRQNPERQEPRQQRARKNTRRWCKGKEGREHVVKTVVHHMYETRPMYRECGIHTYYRWWNGNRHVIEKRWSCLHALRCENCGKYLKIFLPQEECPTWQTQYASPIVYSSPAAGSGSTDSSSGTSSGSSSPAPESTRTT